MNLPITLPVFVHNEESLQADQYGGGNPNSYLAADVLPHRFYRIDSIAVCPNDDDQEYTMVNSGGMGCVVNLPMVDVMRMIENK